ncbi:type II toxin-antitoxin system VapC family toxin [Sphingomonas aestuarii]
MSHYLDTSVLVAALVHEPHSAAIREWLRDRPANSLFIGYWAVTEVHSALSVRVRTGTLTEADKSQVLDAWQTLLSDSLTIIAIDPFHFDRAAMMADHHSLGIRAGDALHLAVAEHAALTLVTFDKTMSKAAGHFSIAVEPI